jgi:hypothetical protein
MTTREVQWSASLSMQPQGNVRRFLIREQAVPFEQAEALVELGSTLLAMEGERVHAIFDAQFGPMFAGLWGHVTWHIVVREL